MSELAAASLRDAHVVKASMPPPDAGHDLSSLRQRAVLEASNAFLITDASQPDNPIIDANPAFTALTGYPREAILGRNCRFLQGPETDPSAIDALRQTIVTDQPQAVILLNYRADGTSFWNEVTVSPLREADERARYYVGIQRDVSARVDATALTAALAAEQARSRLTGAVMQTLRHELHSPLSIICGYTELLLDPRAGATAEQAADLALILQSGRHLERLLSSMLDLAQLQAGTLPLFREAVALPQLLGNLLEEFTPRAAAKAVSLEMVVPPDLVPLHVDPVRLYQALALLLDNAVRFTDHGGVTLTVAEQPGHLVLQMADTGRGMTPEIVQQLFVGLRPGEDGLRREFGGLGMGGALAAGLIAAHGGTTTAESTLGAGTRVTIVLPYGGDASPDRHVAEDITSR